MRPWSPCRPSGSACRRRPSAACRHHRCGRAAGWARTVAWSPPWNGCGCYRTPGPESRHGRPSAWRASIEGAKRRSRPRCGNASIAGRGGRGRSRRVAAWRKSPTHCARRPSVGRFGPPALSKSQSVRRDPQVWVLLSARGRPAWPMLGGGRAGPTPGGGRPGRCSEAAGVADSRPDARLHRLPDRDRGQHRFHGLTAGVAL